MNIDASFFTSIEKSALPGFKFAGGNIGTVLSAALPIVFFAAGTLLLVYLILGGLQFMTARGDPKGMSAAQSKITSALIGFGIVFTAYWITRGIGLIFNITAITNAFQ